MRQPIIDQNGLGYTIISNNVATSFKTVWVKTTLITEVFPNSGKTVNSLTFGVINNVAITFEAVFVKVLQ